MCICDDYGGEVFSSENHLATNNKVNKDTQIVSVEPHIMNQGSLQYSSRTNQDGVVLPKKNKSSDKEIPTQTQIVLI